MSVGEIRSQLPQQTTGAWARGRHCSRVEFHAPQLVPAGAHDWACAVEEAIVRMKGVAHATVPACLRKSRRLLVSSDTGAPFGATGGIWIVLTALPRSQGGSGNAFEPKKQLQGV